MTEKNFDINEDGRSIRCIFFAAVQAREFPRAVICTHGFGCNKDQGSLKKFAEKYLGKQKKDIVIAFDWPCHGKDARKKLDLTECLDYLQEVVEYAKKSFHAEAVFNYSVSFGGYLTLVYMAKRGCPFKRTALRCPGINMYGLMSNYLIDDDREKLSRGKHVLVGFDRKMEMDQGFLDALKENDVRKYEYFDYADDILILHGTHDKIVPIEDSQSFAENNVIELIPVENADHTFRDPQLMDLAIHKVIEFFI